MKIELDLSVTEIFCLAGVIKKGLQEVPNLPEAEREKILQIYKYIRDKNFNIEPEKILDTLGDIVYN